MRHKSEVETTMTRRTRRLAGGAVSAVLVMALAGCRQPDGSMPLPAGEQTNRVDDISRDLQNVARSDSSAPAELLDDLTYLESVPRPPERLKELGDALTASLRGGTLPDPEAKRVSTLIYQMVAARDLSESQIAQIGTDLRETLVKAGSTPEAADRVAAAGSALAGEVTQNKKRWYHR
jgi:hypothetical protein